MAAADAKFAEKMDIKKGLQTGYEAITKSMNKEEFARTFDASIDEVKDTIRKGMRAAVGNLMEKSSQGELTGASRLFDKKAVNRANFRKAFGPDADQVLDNLHQELAFRNTEREVRFGSDTATNQAIRQRYGGSGPSEGPGVVREALKGIAIDASTGSLGGATAVNVLRTGGRNTLLSLTKGMQNRYAAGTADIISRSGAERDNAMSILERVSAVQKKGAASRANTNIQLPIVLSGPLGQEGYKRVKGE